MVPSFDPTAAACDMKESVSIEIDPAALDTAERRVNEDSLE